MVKSVKFDIEAVDKTSAPIKNVSRSLDGLETSGRGLKLGFTEVASAVSLVEKGLGAANKVIDATITKTVSYARSVSDLALSLGVSTEEASYLYQIADDLKIPVASLEMAFKTAIKNGIQPTVKNLKELSSTYRAIENPVERAQYVMKIFGMRAGPELQKLLEATPEAIDAMAESAEAAGLVMSGDSVAAARQYEVALDDLGDAAEGTAIVFGNKLIPPATAFLKLLSGPDANKAADFINEVFKGTFMESDLSKEARNAEGALGAMTDRLTGQYEAWLKLHPELQDGAGEMEDLAAKTWSVNDAISEYSTRLLFNKASMGLTDDQALILAHSMGLINDATLIASQKQKDLKKDFDEGRITAGEYYQGVTDLDTAIRSLTDRHITITTTHIDEYISLGSGGGGGGANYEHPGSQDDFVDPTPVVVPVTPPPVDNTWGHDMTDFAAGGSFQIPPGYNNESYPLGPGHMASSGETVTISPTFHITQQPGQSAEALADMIVQRIEEKTRRRRLSGGQYSGG